jgi:hypothetical protein
LAHLAGATAHFACRDEPRPPPVPKGTSAIGNADWKLFDVDRGIDSAREIREYFDFHPNAVHAGVGQD